MERTKVGHCILFKVTVLLGSHFEFGLVQIGLDLHLYWIVGHTVFWKIPNFLSAFSSKPKILFPDLSVYNCLLHHYRWSCSTSVPISTLIFHVGNKAFRLHPLSIYRYRLKQIQLLRDNPWCPLPLINLSAVTSTRVVDWSKRRLPPVITRAAIQK